MSNAAEGPARDAVIQGLEDLAAFLRANPGVPVWRHGTDVVYCPRGEDKRAEVQRIAALVGAEPEQRPALYRVTRNFGPIAYVAMAQTEGAAA